MKSTGRKGWEAATSRSEQFACKSEDLPVIARATARGCNPGFVGELMGNRRSRLPRLYFPV